MSQRYCIFFLCLLATLAISCSKAPESAPVENKQEVTETKADEVKADEAKLEVKADEAKLEVKADETKAEAQNAVAEVPDFDVKVTEKDQAEWGFIRHGEYTLRKDLTIAFEIPVFNDKVPGYKKINETLNARYLQYFKKDSVNERWALEEIPELPDGESYEDAFEARVTLVNDDIVSVLLSYSWFAGGVSDYGYETFVFDAKTGEKLTLDKYRGKDAAATKADVKIAIEEYLKGNEISEDVIEWEAFDKLTDYKFVVQDGGVKLLFSKYEIAVGAAGGFEITLK